MTVDENRSPILRSIKQKTAIVAFTDGSYRRGMDEAAGVGGYGVCFPEDSNTIPSLYRLNECGPLPFEQQDSLRAELYAVIRAVQLMGHRVGAQLTIITDCTSVACLQTDLDDILRKHGGTVPEKGLGRHADLLRLLRKELNACASRPVIRMLKSQTPLEVLGNIEADGLAGIGSRREPLPRDQWIALETTEEIEQANAKLNGEDLTSSHLGKRQRDVTTVSSPVATVLSKAASKKAAKRALYGVKSTKPIKATPHDATKSKKCRTQSS